MSLLAFALLSACSGTPVPRSADTPGYGQRPESIPTSQILKRPGGFYTDDGPDGPIPVNLAALPDAEPKHEPLNASANEPYSVFGRDYIPLKTAAGYKRQGTASWYGRKFHGQRTVGGEVYDMYAMTAAHPTLPIPSYARVTNLENKRSVVVRINDRGPFGSGRVMDVSYAAAVRLGFAESALAPVDVEGIAVEPEVTAAAPTPAPAPPIAVPEQPALIVAASDRRGIFLQLGAFSSRSNAENFRERLKRQLDWLGKDLEVEWRANLHRVQLGPYGNRNEANGVAGKIRAAVDIKPVVVVR
jgi:rare lipoprotein A